MIIIVNLINKYKIVYLQRNDTVQYLPCKSEQIYVKVTNFYPISLTKNLIYKYLSMLNEIN